MNLVVNTIVYCVVYFIVGGVAVFMGGFIRDRWSDADTPRWTSVFMVIMFGLVLYNLHEFMAAMGSNAGSDY